FGRLVLWAPGVDLPPGADAAAVLAAGNFHHLALANPRLAPYGRAAQQALEALGLWEKLADRLVTGQSLGQAWQFVASGAAELGLLAGSQAVALGQDGSAGGAAFLPIPAEHYDPIIQQTVLLARARDHPAALEFLACVQGPTARAIIQAYGYGVPEGSGP
ncbi:MAG: molybdate ABC transporter substrate-binding protein, partial [Chrysiogenales bacterium]